MLHTINGFLAAAVDSSMVMPLNDNERRTFNLSPFFPALVSFCFSMTIGVLWEFFEFAADLLFHSDAQKGTIIHNIYTVTLNSPPLTPVIAIPDIRDVSINGQSLGLGGYPDIGLIDTMKDLFVNFIGAVVSSAIGYFSAQSKGQKRSSDPNFVPSQKPADQDYLQLTEGALNPPLILRAPAFPHPVIRPISLLPQGAGCFYAPSTGAFSRYPITTLPS